VARKRKKDDEAVGAVPQRTDASGERARLTPADVQQKVFRLAFRGYNERDVDEFLDRITGELAALHEDNKRLREQVAEGGSGTDVSGAERQAETIVRQAREHAARLVEDAERKATMAGSSGTGMPGSFLLEERQFLQQMASLIQDHAQRLKEEARRSRGAADEGGEAQAPPEARSPGATGAMGAAAVAGGAAAAASPPAPEPSPPPPEEATAPWAPVGDEPPRASEEPSGSAEEGDQLVSAWESAFSGDAGEPAPADERARRENEGEPSLRELFWGEE
jgi:DivIVA domain-containing protein